MKRVHLRGMRLAWAVVAAQAGISVVAALIVLVMASRDAASAALYGGIVAIGPTLYMAFRVYLRRNSNAPGDVLGSFYRGQIGKFALTAVLFYFGVMWFAEHFLALILTYMACLIAYPAVMGFASVD